MILLNVRGTPHPQPRPRFHRGRAIPVHSAGARLWIAAIDAELATVTEWLVGPVDLEIQFRMPSLTPGRFGKAHTATPDADNLVKLVMDRLSKRIFKDDAQVARSVVSKVWCRPSEAGMTLQAKSMAEGGIPSSAPGDAVRKPSWLDPLNS